MKKHHNIIISGGWGYRNMGDDFILLETVNLIKDILPDSKITILSYSPNDTKNIIKDIQVEQSIHRLLFRQFALDRPLYYLSSNLNAIEIYAIRLFGKLCSIIYKPIQQMIVEIWYKRINNNFIAKINKKWNYKTVINIFKNADLLVLSGGHYLNTWDSSLISRYIEAELMYKYMGDIIIFGQTIGPFNNMRQQKLATKIFERCKYITVRDEYSLRFLQELGFIKNISIIPDIALYNHYGHNKSKQICIVPFIFHEKYKIIIDIIETLRKEYTIKLVLSQKWLCGLIAAKYLKKRSGNNIEIIIPNDCFELQEILGSSQLVISHNLHGLISAYRSECQIVSLNDTEKTKTFMKIIGKDIISATNLNYNNLITQVNDSLSKPIVYNHAFRERIKTAFIEDISFIEA
jgi:polysaccharide pyruvyl transferase WcaK-like protein